MCWMLMIRMIVRVVALRSAVLVRACALIVARLVFDRALVALRVPPARIRLLAARLLPARARWALSAHG